MTLPPYSKTVAGAIVLIGAAVALKLKLISLTDAGSAAMTGLALMGIGVRAAVANVPGAVYDHHEEQVAKDVENWQLVGKEE